MRRVVPSKKLLLQREISDDNMAYNGEAYGASGFRDYCPTVPWIVNSLEDQNATMVIPWEVVYLGKRSKNGSMRTGFEYQFSSFWFGL